jgi:antitoxin component YwqK of YwqJK toxin-antitoxin module
VREIFVQGKSEGIRTKWHENGKKASEVMISDGQPHGIYWQWNPSGALDQKLQLSNGVPHGVSRAYYPSGFIKAETTMVHGKMVEQKMWKDGERREDSQIDR